MYDVRTDGVRGGQKYPNFADKQYRMAHRKWKETKQQPGKAGPGNMIGCCLVSFHILQSAATPGIDFADREGGGGQKIPKLC